MGYNRNNLKRMHSMISEFTILKYTEILFWKCTYQPDMSMVYICVDGLLSL